MNPLKGAEDLRFQPLAQHFLVAGGRDRLHERFRVGLIGLKPNVEVQGNHSRDERVGDGDGVPIRDQFRGNVGGGR